MRRSAVRAEKRRLRATLEAYDIAKRLGLSTPEAVALAKSIARTPRWWRRCRAFARRVYAYTMLTLAMLLCIVSVVGFAAAMGISVARLIMGEGG